MAKTCRPAQDRGNPSIDQDREPWVRRRLNVFAFVSAPVDTSQHLLRYHTSKNPVLLQSRVQRARSRRRSRDCRGSQGQLNAAIAQVSHLPLEPALECSPFMSAPALTLFLRSLGSLTDNQLFDLDEQGGDEGMTKICEALKGSAVTSLKCATALEC